MPVTRYRSVADMPPPARMDPKDPPTYRLVKELWRFADRLPRLYPPGVYRYRSIEEADAARELATIERMRAIRAARVR